MKSLTVKELIGLLLAMPLDSIVLVEGCDCRGLAVGVKEEVFDDDETGVVVKRPSVLITRD